MMSDADIALGGIRQAGSEETAYDVRASARAGTTGILVLTPESYTRPIQIQETIFPVQFVPGTRFVVFDFGVSGSSLCRCRTSLILLSPHALAFKHRAMLGADSETGSGTGKGGGKARDG
eukprot:1330192-Rhodomonas_salina.1